MTYAVAAKLKEEETLKRSSSGGVFPGLARYCLDEGGVVYGAGWDKENWQVEHQAVDDWNGVRNLQESKYVRSKVAGVYARVKTDLQSGRSVLFSGTPCQVNGLQRYLGRGYRNLLMVDLICHGTPHPEVFEKYKQELRKVLGGKIVGFSFRRKSDSWMHGRLVAKTEKDELNIPYGESPYIKAFGTGLSLCEDCFSCSAKGENRFSDITIGDFWGVDRLCPELFDDKGISLAIVHTPKGAAALERIKDHLIVRQVDLSAALEFNRAYNESTVHPRERARFMREFKKSDMKTLVDRCLYGPLWYRTCRRFASTVKHAVARTFK